MTSLANCENLSKVLTNSKEKILCCKTDVDSLISSEKTLLKNKQGLFASFDTIVSTDSGNVLKDNDGLFVERHIELSSEEGNVATLIDGKVYVPQAVGPQGDQGDKGIQGYKGLQGDKGVQGDKGIQGDKGLQGDKGIQGNVGYVGCSGPQGVQGIKGERGEQGDQGPVGEKGERGKQGEQGPRTERVRNFFTIERDGYDCDGNIIASAMMYIDNPTVEEAGDTLDWNWSQTNIKYKISLGEELANKTIKIIRTGFTRICNGHINLKDHVNRINSADVFNGSIFEAFKGEILGSDGAFKSSIDLKEFYRYVKELGSISPGEQGQINDEGYVLTVWNVDSDIDINGESIYDYNKAHGIYPYSTDTKYARLNENGEYEFTVTIYSKTFSFNTGELAGILMFGEYKIRDWCFDFLGSLFKMQYKVEIVED